jgi:excisionase family DNA binding protein
MSKAPPTPTARWLGYAEAAEYLGCTVRQCHRWVEQGRLPHTKYGLRVQFSPSQLDAFTESCTFTPEVPA